MSIQELCCVQQAWIGLTLGTSRRLFSQTRCNALVIVSIKEKLCNNEMIVTGDQWLMFLYHGYNYDQDDPWNGLFQSSILVSVR